MKNENGIEQKLFTTLIDTKETLDAKLAHSEVQLFSNALPITDDEFTRLVIELTRIVINGTFVCLELMLWVRTETFFEVIIFHR